MLTYSDPSRDEMPAVIPIRPDQPIPLNATVVAVIHGGVQVATSMVREWEPGDIPRCRLCTRRPCVAVGNVCHMVINRVVTAAECYAFRDEDCDWSDDVNRQKERIS